MSQRGAGGLGWEHPCVSIPSFLLSLAALLNPFAAQMRRGAKSADAAAEPGAGLARRLLLARTVPSQSTAATAPPGLGDERVP